MPFQKGFFTRGQGVKITLNIFAVCNYTFGYYGNLISVPDRFSEIHWSKD